MVPSELKWFDSIRVYTMSEFELIRIHSNSRPSLNRLYVTFCYHFGIGIREWYFCVVTDQPLISVRPNWPAPDYEVSNTECIVTAESIYLFIYSISIFARVSMQTYLQLLTSSWLVLLHHKWQLVPSLKQERKYTNVVT